MSFATLPSELVLQIFVSAPDLPTALALAAADQRLRNIYTTYVNQILTSYLAGDPLVYNAATNTAFIAFPAHCRSQMPFASCIQDARRIADARKYLTPMIDMIISARYSKSVHAAWSAFGADLLSEHLFVLVRNRTSSKYVDVRLLGLLKLTLAGRDGFREDPDKWIGWSASKELYHANGRRNGVWGAMTDAVVKELELRVEWAEGGCEFIGGAAKWDRWAWATELKRREECYSPQWPRVWEKRPERDY